MFIDHEYIYKLINETENSNDSDIENVLKKAKNSITLTPKDIATLLSIKKTNHLKDMYSIANTIKQSIYGNRIVVFAPLYVSDFCVNNCIYCGYKKCNSFNRKKLTMEEIQEEVKILESMGHKRLAFEAGEDPVNCPIDYVIDSIKAIYSTENKNGSIRRVNVNIAATSVENYKKLKDVGIGTYILFQETYHKPTYEFMHPKSLKGDYNYHLTAFNRAMEAKIDDVGAGVLFGLYDYKFEVLALMLHNIYLEKTFGVGFHTISVPRLQKADGMTLNEFPHLIDDETFKKIVAILRIAVPFTGIILSTRESADMRKEVLNYGVSQISAGSCTGVGGYQESLKKTSNPNQFDVSDNRSPIEILKELLNDGYIPSYCTACYRMGRTGDRFMSLAKSGQIHNVCTPNAIMTLMEFMLDYADPELLVLGEAAIEREIKKIKRDDIRDLVISNIKKLKDGQRDLYI